jgi:hypothetical protein
VPQGVDDASKGLGIETRGDGDAESVGEDDLDGRRGWWDKSGLWCGSADDWEKQGSGGGVGPSEGAK